MQRTHLICVVHAHSDTFPFEVVNGHNCMLGSVCWLVYELELALSWRNKVCASVLVTKSVTTDDNRFRPARNRFRNSLQDNGLAENGSTEDVTNLDANCEIKLR